MLTNFFRLNPSLDLLTITQPAEFTQLFHNADHVKDIIFEPAALDSSHLEGRRTLFTKKTFENISFRNTTITGITFNQCKFIDCLFVSTRFQDCEFHRCSYSSCNTHKIEFNDTYIDPNPFTGMIDPGKYPNIGVHLFQQLYRNSIQTEQPKFARAAEFNFNKWQRYVLNDKHRKGEIWHWQYSIEWLKNYMFYLFAGYGLKVQFFMAWSLFFIVISIGINYYLWDCLRIVGQDQIEQKRNMITVLYYTGGAMGRFGDLVPSSDLGKSLFLIETFLGLFIVALFLTWLGKRVWK